MAETTSTALVPEDSSDMELKTGEQLEASLKDTYFDFKYAQERFQKIIDEWEKIRNETKRCRLLRYIKADKDTLTTLNLFKEDETYVAVRLIDQNIRAEQPQRLAFITQPRRAVILKPLYGTSVNGMENLESVFTDCARYLAWENPFIKVDDGASTHGWDYVEVVLDTTKPGHFALEHVGHDNLMFDLEAEDINAQEVLGRVVKLTGSQLKQNVRKFKWDNEQVKKVIEADPKNENKTKDAVYEQYKFFFRHEEAIYVCWYGGKTTTDFLLKPQPLYLGIHDLEKPEQVIDPVTQQVETTFPPVAETSYPFVELDYIETEAPKIIDKRGRAFLDEPAQEAASALQSGIVNGVMRASNVYGCTKQGLVPQANDAAPKQTNVKIKHGNIYDKEITFFSTPYPPESAMQALEMTTQYNRLDISKPDYAVRNRQDSRKTATEVAASVNDSAQQASVQSMQQSVFMRKVYTRCYEIFQNRALQGKLPIKNPLILELLKLPVDIKAAGDVDVIQRAEKLQRQQQTWEVVAATPIAMEFLKDYLSNAFPEEAPKYNKLLVQDQQAKQLVMGLSQALKIAITDEQGMLKPEFQGEEQQLQQLAVGVQQFLTPTTEEGAQNGEQQQQAA